MSEIEKEERVSRMTELMRSFSNDVSSALDGTTIASAALIVGGLLVLSVLLYMFDTWATARIDSMLLEQYGPEVYQKMTSSFDPDGVAAALRNADEDEYISEKTDRFGGHFEGWSDEDVIKAYILQELRKQELSTNKYLQPMHPMFTSSSQLAGY